MDETDVFVSGEDGVDTSRSPSIVVTNDDTVAAFCEAARLELVRDGAGRRDPPPDRIAVGW